MNLTNMYIAHCDDDMCEIILFLYQYTKQFNT